MQKFINWNELNIPSDKITKIDIKDAEAMGKVPVGKYLCKCIESTARPKDYANYSCFGADLKWQIEKALFVDGKKVDGDESSIYEGRYIFDFVALGAPEEKKGMLMRRILIAKRCGLINDDSEEITQEMWSEGIIGKQAILNYIDEKWEDEEGVEKTFRKVAFNGYEQVQTSSAIEEDSFDDI